MKFDMKKEGLETILTPWQVELMRWIWKAKKEVDSKMAYLHLQESSTPMSRATAINFLNRMAEEGYLTYREVTAKGGHKRLYLPSPEAPDDRAFRRVLAARLMERARTELMPPRSESYA